MDEILLERRRYLRKHLTPEEAILWNVIKSKQIKKSYFFLELFADIKRIINIEPIKLREALPRECTFLQLREALPFLLLSKRKDPRK